MQLEKKYLSSNREFAHRLGEVERDRVSHFILRLAYCRTEELRRWFLAQECSLMRYRLDSLTDSERAEFMLSNGMGFDPVSNEEKMARSEQLIGLAGVNQVSLIKSTFFK